MYLIPFNQPHLTGTEFEYIKRAHQAGCLSGNGEFTKKCHQWLEDKIGCKKAMLTQSCTAALEMAAILANISEGDEVIMPSYTFVSTANAFVLRGGVPVFVDIRPDTLNIDERLIEAAITSKTKAIVPVHYAGVGCDMLTIMEIATKYNLLVIEDAAQAIMANFNNKKLGSFGHLATFSFHETKNIISGEGGALLINDDRFCERAETIWEKGTNRSKFFRGEVSKYTWIDIGSSYLPSEVTASFLWAQFQHAEEITEMLLALWDIYHTSFSTLETAGLLKRPQPPTTCQHNAHIYYLLLPNGEQRDALKSFLDSEGINAVSHYVPLHNSPAGSRFSKVNGEMNITDEVSACILRLPLWTKLEAIDMVISKVFSFYGR